MKLVLLSIIGLALLLSAPLAEAQGASDKAVSSYTEKVLKRADDGIAYAWTGSPVTDFLSAFLPWSKSVGSVVLSLVDTQLRIVAEQRSLPENTACLRTDLFLIEAKMRMVKEEMEEALKQKNITAIMRLQDLLLFLNDRFAILLSGARDPKIVDQAWHEGRLFDEEKPRWCCLGGSNPACTEHTWDECFSAGVSLFNTKEECGAATKCSVPSGTPTEDLCPFSTDYLPAAVSKGYGCDLETLKTLPGILQTSADQGSGPLEDAIGAEQEGMERILDLILDYTTLAQTFQDLEREIAYLLGRTPPSGGTVDPERPHEEIEGCPKTWPTGKDQDKDEWPDDAVRHDLYNPFTVERAMREYELLRMFQDLRVEEGKRRPAPAYFLPHPDAKQESILLQGLKGNGQDSYRVFNTRQGREESVIFPIGSDAHLTIAKVLTVLTDATGMLSHLAHDIGALETKGLRGFVRDFAYFLRRSCIDRPCSTRLDQVLRIVLRNECFPYTNGEYLQGTDYEDCKEAAELTGISP